ncbi:MAG: YybH family protein [Candidatus Binataceae bacterium]
MSAQEEVRRATEEIISAATKGDFGPFITALDDDVEIFDHVPYRFENKASFLEYLQSVVAGAESTTFAFHQPSYRAITDTTGVVNSYDRIATTPKGGGAPKVQCGRTTFVLAKRGPQWKIVSAHFSPLPKE